MAQQPTPILKEKFSDGKTPDGRDFGDLIDSVRTKNEKIPSADVFGLKEEIEKATTKFKGYHTTLAELQAEYPQTDNIKDFFAWVGSPYPGTVYKVFADGGVWTDTGEVPTQQEIDLVEYAKSGGSVKTLKQVDDKITAYRTPNGTYVICDYSGNISMMITPNGQFNAANIELLKPKIEDLGFIGKADFARTESGDLVFCDKKGFVAAMINASGQFNAADISLLKDKIKDLGFITKDEPSSLDLSEITHILSYGQSLSVGVAGGAVVSRTQNYNNKMFSGGTMPQYSTLSNPLSDWIPLIEASISGTNGAGDETPLSGASDRFIQTLIDKGFISVSDLDNTIVLASAPGEGGQTISALSKGNSSGYYNRVIEQVQAGFNLAQSKGKSYNVPVIFWTQGESDISRGTTPTEYQNSFVELRNNLNNDIKAITGQTNDISIVMYQVASHNLRTPNSKPDIALLMLDMALNTEGFYMATPMYHLEYLYNGTNVHLPSKSYRLMGEYYGYALSQIMQGVNWQPMHIRSAIVQGNIITLDIYAPVYPIAIDTKTVTTIDNYGFSVKNSSNVEIIQSVEIVRNTIKIVCSSTPSGLTLDYAINGTGAGNVIGSRGNIRDSQGDSLKTTISGVNYRLDNWLPISRINL